MSIWDYVKADRIFRDKLPGIKSYRYKILGKNSRGNPVEFSKTEKKVINAELKKVLKENKLK